MKFFIVFAALFAVALAAPSGETEILRQESDVHPEGYHFVSETSDGSHREEEGQLKDVGTDHETLVVHGSYSYVDGTTGEKIHLEYVADENGFQPKGDHLPKA